MPKPKWDVARLSADEKSALKRSAGTMMNGASMRAIEGFYRALTDHCKSFEEPAWFAALSLQCLWHEEEKTTIKELPEILKITYNDPEATDTTRKHCTDFLDINWSEDGFLLGKICNLVRKHHSKHPEIMPDFEKLADDLTSWNHATHFVQRKWLNTICSTIKDQVKTEEEEENVD